MEFRGYCTKHWLDGFVEWAAPSKRKDKLCSIFVFLTEVASSLRFSRWEGAKWMTEPISSSRKPPEPKRPQLNPTSPA